MVIVENPSGFVITVADFYTTTNEGKGKEATLSCTSHAIIRSTCDVLQIRGAMDIPLGAGQDFFSKFDLIIKQGYELVG
jgi:hypothetical protein